MAKPNTHSRIDRRNQNGPAMNSTQDPNTKRNPHVGRDLSAGRSPHARCDPGQNRGAG